MNAKTITDKRPAIFLDRDGVLTKEKGYVTSKEDMEIFQYAAECVRQIHQKGYYAIVITNQSGIARGFFTEESLHEMNDELIKKTRVDAIYYCPHHPEGKIERYRHECECRKPKTGMFSMACEQFDIDMQNSYMVGDRASDIIAGQRMGMKTILLESGYGSARVEQDIKPDFIGKDLRKAIELM